MARFLNRVLQVLDRVYRFDSAGGRQAPDQFDLAGSVQPVHDVSREAELVTVRDATFRVNNVHAGAGSVYGSTTFADLRAQLGLDPDEDFWLQGVSADCVNFGNITNIEMALRHPEQSGAYAYVQWAYTETFRTVAVGQDAADIPLPHPHPERIQRGDLGVLYYTSLATAAATVRFAWHGWVTPRGVLPPGVA